MPGIGSARTRVRAAIDLASIMVGVIVIGVIAGTISATVFAVIPWAQDQAAASTLDTVKIAESSVRADQTVGARYLDLDALIAANRLPASAKTTSTFGDQNLIVTTDTNGTCWVAIVRSATGKPFTLSSNTPKAQPVTPASPGCVTDTTFGDLYLQAGGANPGTVPVQTATQFGDGASHFAAIIDGDIYTWGSDGGEALGIGPGYQPDIPRPAKLTIPVKFKQIAVYQNDNIALDVDGHIWSWGRNTSGELGNGTNTPIGQPTIISTPQTFTKIATNGSQSFALDTTGALWAWGNNVADGGDHLTPFAVNTGGVKFDNFTSQEWYSHAYLYGQDGRVYSWYPSERVYSTIWPVKAPEVVQMSGFYTVGFAVDTQGQLWGWAHGTVADGTIAPGITNTSVPYKMTDGTTQFRSVAAGNDRGAALDSKGNLYRWGYGVGTSVPTKAPGATQYKWVRFDTNNGRYLYAMKLDGTIVVSDGNFANDWAMTPIPR